MSKQIILELQGKKTSHSAPLTPDFLIYILPLIGTGSAFSGLNGVKKIGPQKIMPTGGFVRGPMSLILDLRSGLFNLHRKQIRNAKKNKYALIVCVGDFFLFFLASFFLKSKNIIFVSTAKSDFFMKHYWIERWFLKRCNSIVYARDQVTADNLVARGVNAKYVGNVMMDLVASLRNDKLQMINGKLGRKIGGFKFGLLPGSRGEAYGNYSLIKAVLDKLPLDWSFQLAVSTGLDQSKFVLSENIEIVSFDEMLQNVDAVIGLAGTANEQCIGLGIPVFSFVGNGPQTTKTRFLEQKKLLNGLVEFIDSMDSVIIAKHIVKSMENPDFIQRVKDLGPKVMGTPGAAKKIAGDICCILES